MPSWPGNKLEQELRTHGIVYSVDEYCTSKKCNRCKSDLYNERKCVTGKDGRRYYVKVHSVLCCHNSVCKSMTVDRDNDVSENILELLLTAARRSRDHPASADLPGATSQ